MPLAIGLWDSLLIGRVMNHGTYIICKVGEVHMYCKIWEVLDLPFGNV